MCPNFEELERLAVDELPPNERAAADVHLAACNTCRVRLADMRVNLRLAQRVGALRVKSNKWADDETRLSDGAPPVHNANGTETRAGDHSVRSATTALRIPNFEILSEIHRGGQGVVYQALQTATKRKVAIKVLLEGPGASPSARRRFEREIELAAQLRHNNIVPVFHSGTTEDGRQYCVMDYIRGAPLQEYVRENRVTLEVALSLFAQVCDAVQFAHQRGIIHRDLKPGNILVDADGTPKVLDFGLARRVGPAEEGLATMTHQILGTLPYMSPEQTRGNPDEIDSRTDVYSLGVVLYELLTGEYPYPVVGHMADVLRHIAETPAAPPSRNWKSTSGISARTTGRLRPGRCPIDDEVETIVMRALAKERGRRYQSAGELARDVRNYLVGAPIEAKRDSGMYVLRKLLRRHRTAATAAVLVAALVCVFSVAMTIQSWRLAAERDRARLAEVASDVARVVARDEAEKAGAINDFLVSMLRAPDPVVGKSDVSVAEVLDHAAAGVEKALADRPAVRAAVHDTLGLSYLGLGQLQKAADQLNLAVELRTKTDGQRAATTLGSMASLAAVLRDMSRLRDAETMFQQIIALSPRDTATQTRLLATALDGLADTRVRQARYAEADAPLREALALRRELPDARADDALLSANNLAQLLIRQYRFAEAEAMLREAVAASEEAGLRANPYWIDAQTNLAVCVSAQGRFAEAERLFDDALAVARETLPNDHPRTLALLGSLARSLQEAGRPKEAASLARQTLARRTTQLGPHHNVTLVAANVLAEILIESGDLASAEKVVTDTLAALENPSGIHPMTRLMARRNYAALLEARGSLAAAADILVDVLSESRRSLGDRDLFTLKCAHRLGCVRLHQDKLDEANQLLREATAGARSALGGDHWLPASFAVDLADSELRAGRQSESDRVLLESCTVLSKSLDQSHPLRRRAELARAHTGD